MLHHINSTLQTLKNFDMEEAHPTYILINEGLKLQKETNSPLHDAKLYCIRVDEFHWLTNTCMDVAQPDI